MVDLANIFSKYSFIYKQNGLKKAADTEELSRVKIKANRGHFKMLSDLKNLMDTFKKRKKGQPATNKSSFVFSYP